MDVLRGRTQPSEGAALASGATGVVREPVTWERHRVTSWSPGASGLRREAIGRRRVDPKLASNPPRGCALNRLRETNPYVDEIRLPARSSHPVHGTPVTSRERVFTGTLSRELELSNGNVDHMRPSKNLATLVPTAIRCTYRRARRRGHSTQDYEPRRTQHIRTAFNVNPSTSPTFSARHVSYLQPIDYPTVYEVDKPNQRTIHNMASVEDACSGEAYSEAEPLWHGNKQFEDWQPVPILEPELYYLEADRDKRTRKPPIFRYAWKTTRTHLMSVMLAKFLKHVMKVRVSKNNNLQGQNEHHHDFVRLPDTPLDGMCASLVSTFHEGNIRNAICEAIGVSDEQTDLLDVRMVHCIVGPDGVEPDPWVLQVGTNYRGIIPKNCIEALKDLFAMEGDPLWHLDMVVRSWQQVDMKPQASDDFF
ncbi:uncharacterized protein BXZ73DRAFT_79714 [Epithele typhae]|uniref:uncharacterized protein n=1 Tax=Epithele typhae TaxID=378194 RepID=UPI0020078833|nr:uncharacterized protein BXZ73DRAFT_79714 [Epithele typhae]KAH9922316.1 hypothetical protein BXZ73DRAFT_79714 [Epithele typhae]